MTSTRERRIAKELADIHDDKDKSGVLAQPVDGSDLSHLKGTFPGPSDTPYAGGLYQVDIVIPSTYPFKPPVMKFDTKIWHPNVSSVTGAICIDTLGASWSPVGTIKLALISLRMLLESPNPKDPQDAEVAKMMMNNEYDFRCKAHDWAVKYAGAPRREQPKSHASQQKAGTAEPKKIDPSRYGGYHKDLIGRFISMGFELDAVVEAFKFVGIDCNGGVDYVLEEAYMGDITARLLGEN